MYGSCEIHNMTKNEMGVVCDLYITENELHQILYQFLSALHSERGRLGVNICTLIHKHSSLHNSPKAKKLFLWFGVVGYGK